MTTRTKVIRVVAVSSTLALASSCIGYYIHYLMAGSEYASGTVSRFCDIPRLGGDSEVLEPEGEMEYVVVQRDRCDEFYVAGSVSKESLDAALKAERGAFRAVRKAAPAEPPWTIGRVLRRLDPQALDDWSSGFWLMTGVTRPASTERAQVWYEMAYDPETGRFWCYIGRGRGRD